MIWSTFFFYIRMASKFYWKDYLCSTKLPLHPFWKINWPYACRFMSGLCSAALICVSIFMPVPHSLDCCHLMSWSQIVCIFQLGSFSSLVWPLGPLQFCLRFRFNWSVFNQTKSTCWVLMIIILLLYNSSGRTDILTTLSLSIHKHYISLRLFRYSLIFLSSIL